MEETERGEARLHLGCRAGVELDLSQCSSQACAYHLPTASSIQVTLADQSQNLKSILLLTLLAFYKHP